MFKKYNYDRIKFDEYNTVVLEVLYRKFSRDYLKFFSQMSKLYKRGDNKKKSLETVEKINQTLVFLSHVINGGVLTKKEISDVFVLIDEINASRDYFISESSKVAALRERMEKISKETGISAEDLNLTQEHIRSGIKQVQRSRREGVSSFMKRTAPGTLGLGKNILGGLGTALTGPFAPILGMAGTVLKDIWNVGKGIGGKIREHKERVIGSQMKPVAFGAEHVGFGRENFFGGDFRRRKLGYRKSYGKRKSGYRKFLGFKIPSRRLLHKREIDSVNSLELFYDKKAYKAKWTKELLDNVKGLVKDSKKSSSSLLSWLGKGGLIAATAAGFYLIGNKIEKWLEKKTDPLVDGILRENARLNFEKQQREVQEELDFRKGFVGEKGWAKGLSAQEKKDKLAGARGYQKEFLKEQDVGLTLPKETNWDKLYRPDLPLPNSLPLHPPESIPWLWKGVNETFQDVNKLPSLGTEKVVSGRSERVTENNIKLINSLDKLSQQLEKNRSASPVRGPSIGNSFDAADPLLNNFAAGKLTLGGY